MKPPDPWTGTVNGKKVRLRMEKRGFTFQLSVRSGDHVRDFDYEEGSGERFKYKGETIHAHVVIQHGIMGVAPEKVLEPTEELLVFVRAYRTFVKAAKHAQASEPEATEEQRARGKEELQRKLRRMARKGRG